MSDTKEDNIFQLIGKTILTPIHPAGYPFIGIFAVVALILMQFGDLLGFVGIVLTVWCVYFFRNPARSVPDREGLIVSPADGVVQLIMQAPLPAELQECRNDPAFKDDPLFKSDTVTRVSVFLNVFDVHVNRTPAAGEVKKVVYHPGKFFNASLDKASTDNERSTVLMKLKDSDASVAFVQIAGLVARRIINQAKAGDNLDTGSVYGLIRFGSRVDVFLPEGINPLVSVGQRMIGGESVIADMQSSEPARSATLRE